MPPQEQLYVTPKIGYVDAMPYFRSRHLALISLWATLMETTHASPPNPPYTQNSRWLQSSFPPTANMAFAKLQRTQSLACPKIRAAFSKLHFVSLFTTRLAAQTQTTFSMLQIKTFLKNTFRLSAFYFFILPLLPYKLSEETTQRKCTYVTTYTRSTITIYSITNNKNYG